MSLGDLETWSVGTSTLSKLDSVVTTGGKLSKRRKRRSDCEASKKS